MTLPIPVVKPPQKEVPMISISTVLSVIIVSSFLGAQLTTKPFYHRKKESDVKNSLAALLHEIT